MEAAGVALTGVFGDVVFLALTVAFFGLAWLLVRACERIAGPGEIVDARVDEPAAGEAAAGEAAGARR